MVQQVRAQHHCSSAACSLPATGRVATREDRAVTAQNHAYVELRDEIARAWRTFPSGNTDSVDAVMKAVPDGWAKVRGQWVRIADMPTMPGCWIEFD